MPPAAFPGDSFELRDDLRVVALGGGHGLAASLAALRHVVADLTAVVTVADNGGSSGRLRREFGVLPPGTCGWRWPRSAATTTGAGPGRGCCSTGSPPAARLDKHALGNLLIVSLWELLGEHVGGPRLGGPAARRPRPGAADVGHPDRHHRPGAGPGPGRPRRADHRCAARWRSPPRPAGWSRCTWSRTTRRPARRRWRRSRPPTGWCWGRARGSPASSRTCWCPSCATRSCGHPAAHARHGQPRAAGRRDRGVLTARPTSRC